MEQNTNPQLDRRIKKFTRSLKKDFAADIAHNPSTFRSRVIGKVRAGLPRKRPGRQGNPEVKKAADIYEREYKSQGKDGNRHSVAKQVISDYANLTPEMQKLRRIGLRASVHSFLYDQRSRERRISTRPRKTSLGRSVGQ